MKYDFETPVNRRNEYALKWDGPESELPMWVAEAFSGIPAFPKAGIGPTGTGGTGNTDSVLRRTPLYL